MPNSKSTPATVKAPLGNASKGTPTAGQNPPGWTPESTPPHRAERAHSSKLPPPMVNSGESSD